MALQASPIEAHERTVHEIFSDDFAFEIPFYQRPYAWEKDQTADLLSDLLDARENSDASSGTYFLGSIVLIKSRNDPQSIVVDGQQRLTTLTILLSVLRDLTTNPRIKTRRQRYVYQEADTDSGTAERCRLLLRQQDRAFFQKTIQAADGTGKLPDPNALRGSQLRIAENTLHLRRELEDLDESQRDELVAFVLQRCYLVVVAVPTGDAARRIFRVLNTRGLDLLPTDTLKAELLERARASQEPELASRWESVEQFFGRDSFVELFGHIRMIYERDKPRLDLESGFPKFVTPFTKDPGTFVSEILEPIADASSLLSNSEAIYDQFGLEAARATRSLARLDNKDWVPPALLRLWKRRPGDGANAVQFLRDLERLAYFLFVTRQDVNHRIARFASVMNGLDPPVDNQASTPGLILSGEEQRQFVAGLSGDLYMRRPVCKAVLLRLDEALSSGGARYDQIVSIEHVLPQTVEPGSEWARSFQDENVRKEWTHRLANLVLLTRRINSRASNWDFDRKKKEYFASSDGSSPFVLTQGVLRTDSWSIDHLKCRQAQLLRVLGSVWHLTAGT